MLIPCFYCQYESPAEHHARVVENKTPLYGPWEGWRMTGQYLISPDRKRINPQRLRGLMFRQDAETRLANRRSQEMNASNADRKARIVLIPQRERFEGYA